jgi:hypothetical protein
MVDPLPAERVRDLDPARATAHDHDRIGARRERPVVGLIARLGGR